MPVADISALGNLQPSEALDLDMYRESTGFQLPKEGEYILRAPDRFTAEAFSKTRGDLLQADVSPTIVGPTNEGFQLRRQRLSAKVFEQDGVKISYIGRYLKACGVNGEIPSDPQDLADLVASTAGRTYQAFCQWEAVHFATGYAVKGMKNFPSDGNGGYQQWVAHPTEKDADGSPLRLRAQLNIKRFIAAQ